MTDCKHTALPWKVVSDPHFDSGLVYTSIQPINIDQEAMKPLAMMNGEFHVCRMSHTAALWRFNYHRANAAFIVEACNSYYQTRDALVAKDAEIERLRAALHEIATTEEYRGLSAEEATRVAQGALKGGDA
ncbi:hypothetical protein ACU8KI_08700 [Rhizobium leguminosarum]